MLVFVIGAERWIYGFWHSTVYLGGYRQVRVYLQQALFYMERARSHVRHFQMPVNIFYGSQSRSLCIFLVRLLVSVL
jgi:hypothetical protein